jgi:hypothetical protein
MRRAKSSTSAAAAPAPFEAQAAAPGPTGGPFVLVARGVVRSGRSRFAVGLLWQLRAEGQSLREQARRSGQGGDELDLYAPHAEGRQIGFATRQHGARRGMRAGATNLDLVSGEQNWLGVFALDSAVDGTRRAWWIVAERAGLIYEDRILFDEGEARAAFADAAEAPGWQRIVCPPGWSMPGADPSDLSLAVPLRPKGEALRAVNPIRQWGPRIVIAGMALILGGGLWFAYRLWQLEQARLAEELARIERQARAIEPPPPPPWTVAPRFEAFVATCEAETAGLHLAVPGWRMDPIACTPTPGGVEVVAVWHPDGGRLPELLATFRAHGLADPAISAEAGQLQAIQRRAVALAPRPSDTAEMPLDPAAIEARLRARFDTLALAYALEARGPLGTLREAPLPGGPAAFAFHELALGSSIAPQAFVRLLSDMPALVADSYVWDPANLSWSLVVRIYHPLPSG